jgi:hypothetical protein
MASSDWFVACFLIAAAIRSSPKVVYFLTKEIPTWGNKS